jgi:hypothetical protein
MQRRLTAVLLAVILVLVVADRAGADGTGDAYNDGDEIGAGANDGESSGGSGGDGGAVHCTYERLSAEEERAATQIDMGRWGPTPGTGAGHYYLKTCDDGDGQTTATIVYIPDPTVDPEALAEEALDRTPIPVPKVRLNPPQGQDQVVNVPTWMWVDRGSWQPVTAQATAGAVTVTTTARPGVVRWDMGNGDVVTCAGPGTAYDPSKPAADQHSDCTYTYHHSSASQPGGVFTITVTTTWQVSWTVSGAPGGGSLGSASRTTTGTVRVSEIEALNS